jgi:hypothetical protein
MRKARLDPQYADLYPDAYPGKWVRASVLAHAIRRRHDAEPGLDLDPARRILPDDHFSFSGGQRRGGRFQNTRWTDTPRRGQPENWPSPE